ncbi:MAG TPA: hypothetical protein VJ850_13415 [Candidatus Limnocylindrales bacterium]|nr:hypothetical protein [Candidatus Limnocylindrales bacterium]
MHVSEHRRAVAIAATAPTNPFTRIVDAIWLAFHAIGAHRWRDGYDVDTERGMSQYRGSRCTICDSPWEGW